MAISRENRDFNEMGSVKESEVEDLDNGFKSKC